MTNTSKILLNWLKYYFKASLDETFGIFERPKVALVKAPGSHI